MSHIIGRHTEERERHAELASGPAIRFSLPRVYCRRSPYGRSPYPSRDFEHKFSPYMSRRVSSARTTRWSIIARESKTPPASDGLRNAHIRESGQRPLGRFLSAIGSAFNRGSEAYSDVRMGFPHADKEWAHSKSRRLRNRTQKHPQAARSRASRSTRSDPPA